MNREPNPHDYPSEWGRLAGDGNAEMPPSYWDAYLDYYQERNKSMSTQPTRNLAEPHTALSIRDTAPESRGATLHALSQRILKLEAQNALLWDIVEIQLGVCVCRFCREQGVSGPIWKWFTAHHPEGHPQVCGDAQGLLTDGGNIACCADHLFNLYELGPELEPDQWESICFDVALWHLAFPTSRPGPWERDPTYQRFRTMAQGNT